MTAAGTFDSRSAIAILKFSTNLAAPFGFVIWAVLLDTTSAATTIFIAALLMIITAFMLGRSKIDGTLTSNSANGGGPRV